MVPFDYQPRTRVVFGQGTLARLGTTARDLGLRRPLIVADAAPVQAGPVGAPVPAMVGTATIGRRGTDTLASP